MAQLYPEQTHEDRHENVKLRLMAQPPSSQANEQCNGDRLAVPNDG